MLTILSVLPVLFVLYYIYNADRFHHEPKKLLLKLFILGCLSVIPILVVEEFLAGFNTFTGQMNAFYRAFVIAGFSEEVLKWLVVFVFAFSNKAYDEPLDGIVYAVFVSMGFAVIENIMYVNFGGVSVALLRAFTSIPAHMLFGVMMGFYLSLYKFTRKRKYMILSIIIPIVLHGTYNFILMGNSMYLLLFIPYMIFMFRLGRKRIKTYQMLSYLNRKSIDEEII